MDIGILLQSITTSITIARSVAEAQTEFDRADLKLKMADVMTTLAEAKIALPEARTELHEKDQEIARLKEAESGRYELVEMPNKALVYAVRESARGDQPKHYLCPTCFHKGQRLLMQRRIDPAYRLNDIHCLDCSFTVDMSRRCRVGVLKSKGR
jgi:hypothetical protein